MTKKEFNKIISTQLYGTTLDENSIKSLVNKFPYCESVHKIYCKILHDNNNINFNEILTITSIYSTDRKYLFNIINPDPYIRVTHKKEKISFSFKEWLTFTPTNKNIKIKQNKTEENIKKSLEDNNYLITETLANLYLEQGHYKRALQAYEILCLRFPKKSSLFVDRINKIKNLI